MSRNSKYDELLLQESKRGRNNSYINLSIIYLQKIFALVFELVPIKKEAIKISSIVLYEMWFSLEKIEDLNGFVKTLERAAIIKCVSFLSKNKIELLNDNLINNLSSELNLPILPIEREILKLSSFERICVALVDQVKLNIDFVSRLYKEKELNEILETLNNTRETLIRKFPSEIYAKFSEEQWNKINSYLKAAFSEEKLEFDENLIKLISDYEACSIEIMQDLFRHLVPDQQIIENLRTKIYEEDTKKSKIEKNDESFVKEKKKEKSSKLQDNSKNKIGKKIVISFLILFFLASSIWFIANIPSEWNITDEISLVTLNGNSANRKELVEGDRISTTELRKTDINFNELTTVEIAENSELIIGKTTSNESNLELSKGAINFNSTIDWNEGYKQSGVDYKLKFPNAVISTKKSKFNLSLNENNEFYLSLDIGWLILSVNKFNRNVYLANNYNLKFNNSYLLAVPYHKKSSLQFIEAIEQISKTPTDDNSFTLILNSVDERDALTLWHLLAILDVNKVKLILDKLDNLLLLELVNEYHKSSSISKEGKHNLLKYIISDLLMRNDE